jgi:hypothetical protein
MFIAQLIINPFYTEILEASYLRESTFSVNYLRFQFPVYASNFISFEGFLGITILILLYFKLTKISKAFIALAFLFIILYSFHYRSQFAVRTEEITLFDTFRYMTNVVPLFFGVILFSNLRKFRKLKTLSLIGFLVFLGYNSFIQIKGFIEDEERNYHLVNERIEDSVSKDERALIVDNFNIISILNKKLNNVDVIKYVKGWEEEIDIYTYDRIFIINRFNLIDDNINQIGMSAFKTETTVIGESEVFQIFIE